MGFFIFTFEDRIIAMALPIWPMVVFICYQDEISKNLQSGESIIDYIKGRAKLN